MGNRSIPGKIVKKVIPWGGLAKRTDALAGMIPFPGDLQASPDRSAFSSTLLDTKPREIGELIIHSVHVLKGEPKKKIFPSGKILQPLLA